MSSIQFSNSLGNERCCLPHSGKPTRFSQLNKNYLFPSTKIISFLRLDRSIPIYIHQSMDTQIMCPLNVWRQSLLRWCSHVRTRTYENHTQIEISHGDHTSIESVVFMCPHVRTSSQETTSCVTMPYIYRSFLKGKQKNCDHD